MALTPIANRPGSAKTYELRFRVNENVSAGLERIHARLQNIKRRGQFLGDIHEFDLPGGTMPEDARPTKTRNPYDRRTREDRVARIGDAITHGMPMMAMGGQVGPTHGIAIEDLDAMARSAHSRGEARAADRLTERHETETLRRQHIAWDEGHQEGIYDGQREFIRQGVERFEEPLRKRLALIDETLAGHEGGDRKVTKDVLADQLASARAALAELRSAFHIPA